MGLLPYWYFSVRAAEAGREPGNRADPGTMEARGNATGLPVFYA